MGPIALVMLSEMDVALQPLDELLGLSVPLSAGYLDAGSFLVRCGGQEDRSAASLPGGGRGRAVPALETQAPGPEEPLGLVQNLLRCPYGLRLVGGDSTMLRSARARG